MNTNANLPDTWSANENVVWKTELPGRSWSSPIVWGDRLLLRTAARLYCLQQGRKAGSP